MRGIFPKRTDQSIFIEFEILTGRTTYSVILNLGIRLRVGTLVAGVPLPTLRLQPVWLYGPLNRRLVIFVTLKIRSSPCKC